LRDLFFNLSRKQDGAALGMRHICSQVPRSWQRWPWSRCYFRVEAHVPRGAIVEVGRRGPHLDTNAFQVEIREMQPIDYKYAAKWRDNLEDNWLYPRLRSAVLELERRLSASDRKPYQAWFDRTLDREPTPPATAEVVPDCRIFTDRDEIARLEAEHSGYRRVATLRRGSIFGLEFRFPFVNPVVHIYERGA
jgi:hypothetical protein